MTPDALMTA